MGVDGGKGLAHRQKPWPRDPGTRGVGCRRAAGDCGRDGRTDRSACATVVTASSTPTIPPVAVIPVGLSAPKTWARAVPVLRGSLTRPLRTPGRPATPGPPLLCSARTARGPRALDLVGLTAAGRYVFAEGG